MAIVLSPLDVFAVFSLFALCHLISFVSSKIMILKKAQKSGWTTFLSEEHHQTQQLNQVFTTNFEIEK